MAESIDEIYDLRRHRRVPASGTARVNFGGQWHSCPLVDLSGGGARFVSQIRPLQDANVLVQIRGVGMVRAKVVARTSNEFSVAFNQNDFDSGAMVDNLMLHANAELLEQKASEASARTPAASVTALESGLETGLENTADQDEAAPETGAPEKSKGGLRRLIGR